LDYFVYFPYCLLLLSPLILKEENIIPLLSVRLHHTIARATNYEKYPVCFFPLKQGLSKETITYPNFHLEIKDKPTANSYILAYFQTRQTKTVYKFLKPENLFFHHQN